MQLNSTGAVFVKGDPKKTSGDVLVLLRDPWGIIIQLAKRAQDF
jgi:hypothetical protein